MLTDILPVKPKEKVASPGDAVMNAIRVLIAPMVGAPKSVEHPVHVVLAGETVDAVSTPVKNANGIVRHEIPGFFSS